VPKATDAVVYCVFLLTDPEALRSISGATGFSEK
jgi:hypothetical protein